MNSTITRFECAREKTINFLKNSTSRIFGRKVFSSEGSAHLALFLFTFVYFVVTYLQLSAQTAHPSWDDSWYLTNSEIVFKAIHGNDSFSSIYYGIKNIDRFHLFSLFSPLMGGRAPLITVLSVPNYSVFGTGFSGLTAIYLLLIILFNIILYKFISKLTNLWTTFLAVAITNTMPFTVGLSRYFVAEYGLIILVAS